MKEFSWYRLPWKRLTKFRLGVWFLLREMFYATNNEQHLRVMVLWQFVMLSDVRQAEGKCLEIRSAFLTPEDCE